MIARVFPRKTKASPCDALAFFGPPDLFVSEAQISEVHVSVTFTWDLKHAQRLADQWQRVAPISIGGPAMGLPGGEFVSGRYLRHGYTITSRGCPRKCWFCRVPRVEGGIRELPIMEGWNVLDDNILATTRPHFESVCEMLSRQPQRAQFTGGLDAQCLQDWHIDAMSRLTPRPVCFFAYDPGDDYEPLAEAADLLLDAGWTIASHLLRCYVLIGYPRDSMDAAEKRLQDMLLVGFTPMAMLYRDPATGHAEPGWQQFQRRWARPAIIHSKAARAAGGGE